jgi:hypothetical protein
MLASDMPSGATDCFDNYAPQHISTINTGITAEDLDWLIIDAMQRAEGDSEEVLHNVTRQQKAPGMRTLTAKQYNSHKRSKKRQKKERCKGREGEGGVEEMLPGEFEDEKLEGQEQQPHGSQRGHSEKRKSEKLDRKAGERTGADGAGQKRRAGEGEQHPPKRAKVNPPSLRITSPPTTLTNTVRRRYRRKMHMQAAKAFGSGYWASEYVKEKVAKAASTKRVVLNMHTMLKARGQKGSYRPKVEKLDARMERLKHDTNEVLNKGTNESVARFLEDLVEEEGYQLFQWDGASDLLSH